MTIPTAYKTIPGLALLALTALPQLAEAQSVIKQPGNHPDYSVELEPHFLFQWTSRDGADDGFGPGVRVNIPFLRNGPIKTINNNMAIGVGLDLSFGDGYRGWCYGNRYDKNWWLRDDNCSVTEVWLPVVLQWNFFLTKVISVFGEPGFAIAHRRYSYDRYCDGGNGPVCDDSRAETDPEFVFWGGGRFTFTDTIGLTVRVGVPYVSAGVHFLL